MYARGAAEGLPGSVVLDGVGLRGGGLEIGRLDELHMYITHHTAM